MNQTWRTLARSATSSPRSKSCKPPLGPSANVVSGETVERLYREIRSLRIYEGATEVQQLIIGRDLLKGFAASSEGKP